MPLAFIVTNTTRPPRPDEVDGVHYHFVSSEEFQALVRGGGLLEHACVYGYWYGAPKAPVREALSQGRDALIKVDVQGAESIRRALPQAVLIFLTPPSMDDLTRRLRQRHTESEAELEKRLKTAREEMSRLPIFDYVVVNADGQIERALADIEAIIRAERLKVKPRQYRL